jgi:hypothetical protein
MLPRMHTHPYEYTHKNEKLSQMISTLTKSHRTHLAIDRACLNLELKEATTFVEMA